MALPFPTALFKQIKENTDYLAPLTSPLYVTYNLDTGSSVIAPPFVASQMMMFISGNLDPLDNDTITVKFEVEQGGDYYPWYDSDGNLITYSLPGDVKRVWGPLPVPHKTANLKITEYGAVTSASSDTVTAYPIEGGHVNDIKVDATGNVYIASTWGEIYKYSYSGYTLLWSNSDATSGVTSLDVDSEGNVYFCDDEGAIYKCNSSGTLQWTYTVALNHHLDSIVYYDGYVYVLDLEGGEPPAGERVVKFRDNLTEAVFVWSTPTGTCENNILLATENGVYCSDSGTVKKLSLSTGSVEASYSTGSHIYHRGGIVEDSQGNIIVTGSNGRYAYTDSEVRVVKFSSDLNLLWTYDYDKGDYVVGASVEVDNLDNIYVSTLTHADEIAANKPIFLLDSDGIETGWQYDITDADNEVTAESLALLDNKIYFGDGGYYSGFKVMVRLSSLMITLVEY